MSHIVRRVYTCVAALAVAFLVSCGGSDEGPTPPEVVLNAPGAPLAPGDSFAFAVTVDGEAGVAVLWSLPDGPNSGTLSTDGHYVAGSVPGTYRVVAKTATDPVGADTVFVTVVLTINIEGADTLMGPGMEQQFLASTPGAAPGITWSLPAGVVAGTITNDGLYTAGATPGTYKIVARTVTVPAFADTVSVTVIADPAAPTFAAHADTVDPWLPNPSYSVVLVAGLVYHWTIAGGVVVAGSDSTSVSVDPDGRSPSLILQVKATNAVGRFAIAVDTVAIVDHLDEITGPTYGAAVSAQKVIAAMRWLDGTVELRDSTGALLHNVSYSGIPVHGAFSGNGAALFVVNQTAGSVARIVTASGAITTTAVGHEMYNLTVAPDSSALYVTTGDNLLFKLDPANLAFLDTLVLNGPSNGLAIRNGQLWVGTLAGRLYHVDPATLAVLDSITVAGAAFQRLALNADASRLYAADQLGTVKMVNTATKTVTSVPVTGTPAGVAVLPDDSEVWFTTLGGTIQRRHPASLALLGTLDGYSYSRNIAFAPDGSFAFIGSEMAGYLIHR